MATTFPFELVSPERLLVSEPVQSVAAPGIEGEFMVLAGHAPFMTTLKPGVVTVEGGSGDKQEYFIRGGFAEVTPEKGLTLLAEEAIPLSELKADQIAAAIKDAQEDVADAASDEARRKAEEHLARLQEVALALGHGNATRH